MKKGFTQPRKVGSVVTAMSRESGEERFYTVKKSGLCGYKDKYTEVVCAVYFTVKTRELRKKKQIHLTSNSV